jgi:hypothetical protein
VEQHRGPEAHARYGPARKPLDRLSGKIESAERAYMRALEASGFPISDFKTQNITTTYNLARYEGGAC